MISHHPNHLKPAPGGFCLRAPAQGACTYANICEHCSSLHTEPSSLPILAAQRVDAQALARDAEERSWITEAERRPIPDRSVLR